MSAAAHHPDRVLAAASIHGILLAVDPLDSPHRTLPGSQAEFYVVDDEVEVDFSANGSATLIDYSGHSATPFVRTSHPK